MNTIASYVMLKVTIYKYISIFPSAVPWKYHGHIMCGFCFVNTSLSTVHKIMLSAIGLSTEMI